MQRRDFLRIFGAGMAMACLPVPGLAKTGAPAIPVLMFHKVDDNPQDPESLSSTQLAALLDYLWANGFCPVNISDILDNRVDKVVPKGLKPVAITADDAHRSVMFSRADSAHAQQRNARSLVQILRASLQGPGYAPRATFFAGRVEDDRISKQPAGYFGGNKPLDAIMDSLNALPGLEIGYHTVRHIGMRNLGADETRRIIQEQQADFAKLGVLERVAPILAYPYGLTPTRAGLDELRRLGFKGAVLAFPGLREATFDALPACEYNGRLLTDPFLIPRVCIGAHTYPWKQQASKKAAYLPINPLEDFRKDALEAAPDIYISKGA